MGPQRNPEEFQKLEEANGNSCVHLKDSEKNPDFFFGFFFGFFSGFFSRFFYEVKMEKKIEKKSEK